MVKNVDIGGRLHSTATGNIVTGANEVYDDDKGKKQSEINSEIHNYVENINNALENLNPEQQEALDVAEKTNNNEAKLGYYVCNTEADVAAKVVSNATCYVLGVGGSIKVKMTNANSAANVTLNINSTEAKPLYYDGERASANNSWEAGETVEIYYDGTNFYANNVACGGKFATGEKVNEVGIDDGLTAESDKLVKSGRVNAEFEWLGDDLNLLTRVGIEITDTSATNLLAPVDFIAGDIFYINEGTDGENFSTYVDGIHYYIAKVSGTAESSLIDPSLFDNTYSSAEAIRLSSEYRVVEGAVYDVSAKNPTAGPNNDGKFESLSALLSDANLNTLIPTSVRRGGMSIKFVQSSDNKYVQARLMIDEWSTDTDEWAIADEGVYVENPEFVYVKTDVEDKILYGVKTDGEFFFGAGCPQQVKEYVEEKIADLSLDEYEDIVEFLNDYLGSDTTLKAIIDGINATKVDKEEGKSLIDAAYASTKSTIDNPEFLDAKIDAEEKILEALRKDGTKIIGGDLIVGGSAKVLGEMDIAGTTYKVVENSEFIAAWLDEEDKVIFGLKSDGKTYVGDADFLNDIKNNQEAISEIKAILDTISSAIDSLDIDALSSITAVENPEFLEAKTDLEGKLLAGRTNDGTAFENVGFSTPKVSIDGHRVENIEDIEGRSEIKTDSEGKILSYRDSNGVKHEEAGLIAPNIKVMDNFTLEGEAESTFITDIKASMNMPFMLKKFNLPDYGSIDVICEIWYVGTDNNEYTPAQVTKLENTYYVTETLTAIEDPITHKITYEVNENSIATTYTEIDVDFEDATRWPVSKSIKHYCKVAMKFGNIDGTWYALVSFQGTSTLTKPKKGLRIVPYKKVDFAKKDKLKIGEMVTTSKFNCKAYYSDRARMRDITLQRLIVEARGLRDYNSQYPWNSDYPMFTGATGTIMSFPVKLTTSGNFYGVSFMGLAKDKSNYMLDGDATGMIVAGKEFAAWNAFVPEDWEDEMNDEEDLTEHGHTPSNYAALNMFFDWINNGVWDKNTVPQHLSVIDWIDYYIFCQMFRMRDNDLHNLILYSKADKQKFYPFLYDLDLSWGEGYGNDTVMPIDRPTMVLWKKLVDLYWEEIVDRYHELRSTVLNYNHVSNIVTSIQASIPYSDLELEMNKWNQISYTNATKIMLDSFKKAVEDFDKFFIK